MSSTHFSKSIPFSFSRAIPYHCLGAMKSDVQANPNCPLWPSGQHSMENMGHHLRHDLCSPFFWRWLGKSALTSHTTVCSSRPFLSSPNPAVCKSTWGAHMHNPVQDSTTSRATLELRLCCSKYHSELNHWKQRHTRSVPFPCESEMHFFLW